MVQDIFCPSCGRKLFDIDDDDPISYLREMVEDYPRCECGSMPYVGGVRFE
jgi:C4-type Zn-finger protein